MKMVSWLRAVVMRWLIGILFLNSRMAGQDFMSNMIQTEVICLQMLFPVQFRCQGLLPAVPVINRISLCRLSKKRAACAPSIWVW